LRAADGSIYVGEMMEEIAARDESDQQGDEDRPVGISAAFLRTIEQLEQAARSDAPVLLIGETGTGKELAASFIHRYSQRRKHPFIALDCTVVTESLFESEVFGHERGAFTGSAGTKEGLFEVAGGGTLFIDEIGEATLNMQAKLLRVLELGEYRRVGGNKTLAAKARIVCATNRLLWDQVKRGEFREDLYYRIACFCIRIPSLRERMEDIPVLCEEILTRISGKTGRRYQMTEEAIQYLSGYNFPGNVRELRNILQVAVVHSAGSPGGMITAEKVKQYLRMRDEFHAPQQLGEVGGLNQPTELKSTAEHHETDTATTEMPKYHESRQAVASPPSKGIPSLKNVEAQHIAGLLRLYAGNRRKVADAMGVSERTLYRKLKRHNLSELR
jgi:DNA-binding NtrC family response regulator